MSFRESCSACVLPASPVVSLDESGRCLLCRSPETLKHLHGRPYEEELSRLIDGARESGTSAPYDCLVGWSGGRDSTFLINELVRTHGLRCVAVFGKTPFTPIETVESVRSIAEDLGVDLIEIDTPSHHLEVARFCLKKFGETGEPILINLACASCKFVNREVFRLADKLGVRTIIYGGQRYEYLPFGPAAIDIDAEDRFSFFNMVRDNIRRVFKGFQVIFRTPGLLKYLRIFFQASLLYLNPYTLFFRIRYPRITGFDYFFYADWNEAEVLEVLDELGWKLPSGCTTTWRADCEFEAVKNTAFRERLGFTFSHALYSNLIRAGKMTREEALARLEKEGTSEGRLSRALDACGLGEAEVFGQGQQG
ncbi:hypothetical protein ACFL0I_02830 [Gemmatimonadota bacterium]